MMVTIEVISNDKNDDEHDENDENDDDDDVNTVMTLILWPARPLLLFLPIESSYKVVISIKKKKKKKKHIREVL